MQAWRRRAPDLYDAADERQLPFGLEERQRLSKLVFVNRFFHPDHSATSQLLSDLASSLAAAGHETHVVCSRQLSDHPRADLRKHEQVGGVTVHRVSTTRFGRGRLFGRTLDYATFYLSAAIELLRLLKVGDTVIAETDPPLVSVIAICAAKLKGARLVNWLQDIFPEVATHLGVNLPSVVNRLLRFCRDFSLKHARINVVLGERMAMRVLRQGVAPEKITVIENWAEILPPSPKPPAASELRLRLGLTDKFVVGYSGNLGRAHEFQTLLGAADMLRGDDSVIFLMIGGGVGMRQLMGLVAQQRLENFLFLPYQPRDSLPDSLAASDVHWVSLQPALEGLIVPSKFFGILAAERPVVFIGDPEGEIARIIRIADCGSVVSVGDAGGLVKALLVLKGDPVVRARAGSNGHRRYREHYSADRAFEQWRRILES